MIPDLVKVVESRTCRIGTLTAPRSAMPVDVDSLIMCILVFWNNTPLYTRLDKGEDN